jgi:hypothetical protein
MKVTRIIWLCTLAEAMSFMCWAQQANRQDSNSKGTGEPTDTRQSKKATAVATQRRLHREVTPVHSEIAQVFQEPLKCDADGNLYLRTEPSGIGAIHKLNSKGERIALFQPISPNIKVNAPLSFAISPGGEVYQLISAFEKTPYVFVYDKDGSLKSEIKLQTGFLFYPKQIAVFSNGDFLVSGLEYGSNPQDAMWPFTGIFASDGSLRKELTLKDDQRIHDMAASGDPKVSAPGLPSSNRAITSGKVETGADGNVYLMRRLSPAIVYAISPGGAVRRFEVDPGSQDLLPTSMHIVGSRMAVLFWQPQTRDEVLKVVDLQGHEVATYFEPAPKNGEQSIGAAFVCYSQNPERFIFLETMEDSMLGLITATP